MAKGMQEEPEEAGTQGLLSLEEAAAALDVSRSTLTRWLNEGRVRGFKAGRQWRFRRSDLDKFGQMAHPSAAAVNVAEVEALTRQLRETLPDLGEYAIEPELVTYPGTEEEKAIEALFEAIVIGALPGAATDLHFEPRREEVVISQRLDGVLHEMVRLPRAVYRALVACIKSHADMAVDQEAAPQDGRFRVRWQEQSFDLRVATIPSVFGESVTMRMLSQSHFLVDIDRLGMAVGDKERYLRALNQPNGLVLVTGPTGSGKTTVVYSGLLRTMSSEKRTYTVEDPVEISFDGATQIPVNRRAGLTFENALRALMRHDPDVIVAGEIQDLEVGELCLQAAVTGHLVMSTLHANTAAGAITRLLDMGLEPFMLTASLIALVGTRLARKVCPECVQPDEPAFAVLSPFAERARVGGYALPDHPKFVKGKGCERCRHTGYRGRTSLMEVLEVNDEIQRLILERAPTRLLQEAAVRNGMTTLAADGMRKAAEGITTVWEAARVTHGTEG